MAAPKIFLKSEEKLKKQVKGIGAKIARSITGFSFAQLKKELDLAGETEGSDCYLVDPAYPEKSKKKSMALLYAFI